MSCYIDPLFSVHPDQVKNAQAKRLTRKHGQWCHLACDGDDAELLCFGAKLGMRFAWVQNLGTAKAHFDLVPSRWADAVRRGAIEITREEMLALIVLKRAAMDDKRVIVADGMKLILDRNKAVAKPAPASDLFPHFNNMKPPTRTTRSE